MPQLPGYLRIQATLTGYVGSGRMAMSGGLNLLAEGPEAQDASTKTYTGVSGKIVLGDITANFTVEQPRTFAESYAVPAAYQSNGQLLVINAIDTGTQTDLILNLPGPQLYLARSGTLTISESTLVKAEGQNKLYRLQGTFQAALFGTGVGTSSAKDYAITGTFDLLLVE
ncbi:hypothetical protein [Spirosoma endbachense]|uniref:Uncharacterized protein n=1 Tax=Spirosoma endbachense TaxID=2666025 RepID=A0A6P1W5X8_9BACT|nr:hypothetical protein [Spirosoma endbachense]QHW00315.1 hypothetical protein GJR95_37165 [Spirosoma endbachense]